MPRAAQAKGAQPLAGLFGQSGNAWHGFEAQRDQVRATNLRERRGSQAAGTFSLGAFMLRPMAERRQHSWSCEVCSGESGLFKELAGGVCMLLPCCVLHAAHVLRVDVMVCLVAAWSHCPDTVCEMSAMSRYVRLILWWLVHLVPL